MKDRQEQINNHVIELWRISSLTSVLEVAASNAPLLECDGEMKVQNFCNRLSDAFSLIHDLMEHHISELNELLSV